MERLRDHLRDTSSTHKARWLRKLNVQPDIFILDECDTLDELNESEIFWIDWYKRNTPFRLTNLTDGGGGLLGRPRTEKTKAKISAARKGTSVSTSTRQSISEGLRASESFKDAMRDPNHRGHQPDVMSNSQKHRESHHDPVYRDHQRTKALAAWARKRAMVTI